MELIRSCTQDAKLGEARQATTVVSVVLAIYYVYRSCRCGENLLNRRERRAAQKRNNETSHQIVGLLQQAISLHQQGQLQNAAALYNQILQIEPEHGDALHLLGVVHLQCEDHSKALAFISRAIANELATDIAYNNLGVALRSLGRHGEAAVQYRKAVNINPEYLEARVNLGNALRASGKTDDALVSYRETLSRAPECADAHSGLALALTDSNAKEEAAEHHRRAVELDTQSAVFQTNLGYLQFEEKTLEKALNTFRHATLLDERYAPAHFGIATVLQAIGQGAEAEQAARSGLAIDDSDALGWNVLGLTLKLQNRDEEAEEAFNRSLSLDP